MLFANNLVVDLVLLLYFVLYFDIHGSFYVRQQRSLLAESVLVSAVRSRNHCDFQRRASLCSTCLSGTGICAHANCSSL
jgi:hypothetical protein